MANITDIKSILYTEKSLSLQENGTVVIQTAPKVTKNQLKEILKTCFGFVPLKVNSANQAGKVKNFRGKAGKRADYKKFYVKLPEGAKLESLEV
ncbi:MAG: LSU ribosomal protein L23p (L23Ae) [uncultured Campylobacterales bacterium]|uniref:Large ribosomal subunit protein uL23 n=1 Tax=uncultured Campylobacterales bacterium TaxID=352960 RepID=A0A6S6SDA3_9BACT|nr:MAG: LSU ribosomal protein L23p (L23Ae) [uncultured Campylobacterales bacterium]